MPDKDLINQLLLGNKKALRVFYSKFAPKLKNFIACRVADEKDVEEILQDTVLDSLDALRDFTGSSSLYTYLCAIAKYKTVNYYRKKKLKRIVFSRLPAAEQFFSIITTPEEELDEKLSKEKVHEILTFLRPKYSKALKLRYLKGFSVKEVARKMSISFKAAESVLFRARREFALVYEKRFSISKTSGSA